MGDYSDEPVRHPRVNEIVFSQTEDLRLDAAELCVKYSPLRHV